MTPFDIGGIQNETVAQLYRQVLWRRDYIARSVKDAFGADRASIQTSLIDEAAFNAYARRGENAYLIELPTSVPLLLLVLFEKLLSSPQLFPWIDAACATVKRYEVKFIADPIDFAGREPWDVDLTAERSHAASMLADLTVAFVQMHELGHVLCGHVDANLRLTGRLRMAELVQVERVGRKQLERECAWEADADAVAMTFIADQVFELLRKAHEDARAAAVFDRCTCNVEHVTAIVIVCLWAMFAYVRGARYRLRRHGSHPHPLVRTYYIKDMLIAAVQRKTALNMDVLLDLIDTRLEEMLVALQAIGLSKNHLFDGRYVTNVEREVERMALIREKHRAVCAPWAWFSWSPTR